MSTTKYLLPLSPSNLVLEVLDEYHNSQGQKMMLVKAIQEKPFVGEINGLSEPNLAHVRNLKQNAVAFYLSSLAPLAGELHDDVMERNYNKINPAG